VIIGSFKMAAMAYLGGGLPGLNLPHRC